MKQYEYKSINIGFSIWTGKSDADYLDVINREGRDGWRFVQVMSNAHLPKKMKGVELVFEREIDGNGV